SWRRTRKPGADPRRSTGSLRFPSHFLLKANDKADRSNPPTKPAFAGSYVNGASARNDAFPAKQGSRETVPHRWEPVGPSSPPQRRRPGDSRPAHASIVEGSSPSFLAGIEGC